MPMRRCIRLCNVYDPAFMRKIKRTLNAYQETMDHSPRKSLSREAFVDVDEKGAAWYLGHMASATLALQEKVKDADFVLEIRDARLPFTTENPNLRRMLREKPRLIVFNKAELSNEDCNRAIQNYYESTGAFAIFTSAKRSWRDIVEAVQRFVTHILPTPTFKTTAHIGLVVGMPNVGKSTLINALRLAHEYQFHRDDLRRSRAPETVSITPGTTRGLKLVPLSRDPNIVLYDSPGLTLPGCFAKESGLKLAACGIVPTNDMTLPRSVVARYLYDLLIASGSCEHMAECLHLARAPISFDDCIAMICERSGMSGQTDMGNPDPVRAHRYLIHDFQMGNLGRITLDPLPRKFSSSLTSNTTYLLTDDGGQTAHEQCGTCGSDEEGATVTATRSSTSDQADESFVYTHEVRTTDVVSRYHDHMREVLQELQGPLRSGQAGDNGSTHAGRRGRGRGALDERPSDDVSMVISRRKGPISRTTAMDEGMRRNTRLAPDCTMEQPRWTRLPVRTRPHRNPLADNDDEHPMSPDEFHVACERHYPGLPDPIPRLVDVGCAFGGMLLALAPLFPTTCMLGLEIRGKVASFAQQRTLRLRADGASDARHHYRNVWFEQLNVMKFGSNCFRKGQLARLFFCYPDPHWKRKNVRRRIISPGLLHEYAYWLQIGGLLYTVSDVEELEQWMTACLDDCPLFRRATPDELATEEEQKVLAIVTDASEDAQRTERKGLQKYFAVHVRIDPYASAPCTSL